jgi:hypothetical protein
MPSRSTRPPIFLAFRLTKRPAQRVRVCARRNSAALDSFTPAKQTTPRWNPCSYHPRNADDHFAVALAWAAQSFELGDGRMVEPIAIRGALVLEANGGGQFVSDRGECGDEYLKATMGPI